MQEKVPNTLQSIHLHCFNGDPVTVKLWSDSYPGTSKPFQETSSSWSLTPPSPRRGRICEPPGPLVQGGRGGLANGRTLYRRQQGDRSEGEDWRGKKGDGKQLSNGGFFWDFEVKQLVRCGCHMVWCVEYKIYQSYDSQRRCPIDIGSLGLVEASYASRGPQGDLWIYQYVPVQPLVSGGFPVAAVQGPLR